MPDFAVCFHVLVPWAIPSSRRSTHRSPVPGIQRAYHLRVVVAFLWLSGEERQSLHARMLTDCLLRSALARDYVELVGPAGVDQRGPIVSFGIRGCASLNDMARVLSDSYGVMCRSGHMCAQPVVDSFTSGEVLRASAYIYNTASEIETLFGGLDELVKWFAPSWPLSEIDLANECHPRMIFASSSRRRVTHTETMCSEVGQCRVNCHGAPSPSAGSILRFALPSAESVKAKRSTGSARLKPRALM